MAGKNRTKRNRISSSNLFLMELIVALLIFSVSSAACVSVFMKAHTMSEEAVLLSRGTDAISSLAELLRSEDTPEAMTAALMREYPFAQLEKTEAEQGQYISARIPLDGDGRSCKEEAAVTVLTVDGKCEGSMLDATLLCREAKGSDDVIADLAISHYFAGLAEPQAAEVSGGQIADPADEAAASEAENAALGEADAVSAADSSGEAPASGAESAATGEADALSAADGSGEAAASGAESAALGAVGREG